MYVHDKINAKIPEGVIVTVDSVSVIKYNSPKLDD